MTPTKQDDALAALDWFNGIIDVFHSMYEATEPEKEIKYINTIRQALTSGAGGDKPPYIYDPKDGTIRRADVPDKEEMAHAAACLLLPNNGVSDTVWYRHGMTLYEFLASYSGKELTGVVEDDYEILTGEKYPLPAAPGKDE